MIKTICYISDSCLKESSNDLSDLFTKAKINNLNNSITGILIHSNSNFLQVLEGDETVVNNVFKKISLDSRHKNIFNIVNTTINQRMFEDYNFGFTIINTPSMLDKLNEYLEWLKTADDKLANKVISIVENFIEQNSENH